MTDTGANASAEEQEEGVEDGARTVIDVVHFFRLQFLGDEDSGTRAFTSKKDFMTPFKGEPVLKSGCVYDRILIDKSNL